MTQYVALFGDPVAGNPTSAILNAAFESAGLDWRYLDIRVSRETLPEAMTAARTLEFSGLNLTVPHKVAVVPLVDRLDRTAEIIGAVNTVRREGGSLIGSNTDGAGFISAVRHSGLDPSGLTVVLVGAGGAAQAAAVELAVAGAKRIVVANRSPERAATLVARLEQRTSVSAEATTWTGEFTPPACDLLVNCTPLGMGRTADQPDLVPVRLEGLAASTVVADLNPESADTAFLRRATAAGHRTLDGLEMLARLAAECFRLWTGHPTSPEAMRAELERVTGSTGG
ncbi:MAG: shikimate dehydrogenase [Mycobacteriales bacterium]